MQSLQPLATSLLTNGPFWEEEGERKDVPPKKSAGRKQCDKLHPTDIPHQHDKIMKADTRQKMKLPLSVPPPPPPPLPSKRKKKAARTPKKTKRVVRVVRRVNTSGQPSTSGKVLEQIISKQSLEEQYKRNIDRKQEVALMRPVRLFSFSPPLGGPGDVKGP